MITISLRDKNVVENMKAINVLRQSGNFSEKEIQELYDVQLENDVVVGIDLSNCKDLTVINGRVQNE